MRVVRPGVVTLFDFARGALLVLGLGGLLFLLLFTFSGYLSDKYNKKDILVYGALS